MVTCKFGLHLLFAIVKENATLQEVYGLREHVDVFSSVIYQASASYSYQKFGDLKQGARMRPLV
jgi:hypothetical protein